jgi:hypothetical protein
METAMLGSAWFYTTYHCSFSVCSYRVCFFGTMVRYVNNIKVAKLDVLMEPSSGWHYVSIARVDVCSVTPQDVVDLLKELKLEESDASFQLFYKHGEDYVVPDVNMAGWPESCCDGDCFKVWYRTLPLVECSCNGIHAHYPPGSRHKKLSQEQYMGYVLLQAVQDGCPFCLKTLLGQGVSPNFCSLHMKYKPMCWAVHQLAQGNISQQQFDMIRALLVRAGADPSA